MKRLLAILCVLLFGSFASAQITELTSQRVTTSTGGATTLTFTFAASPANGNLVVFCFSWRDNTTVSAVPHSVSLATNGGDANGIDSAIYYKIATGSEGTTWTFTFAASVKSAGVASEWSGITTSPLDKTNSNLGSASSAGTTGATGVLSQSDELVVTVWGNIAEQTWSAHDNGLVEIGEIASTGGGGGSRNNTSMATKVTTVTDSINYGATLSQNGVWSTAVATFKGGAAPPPTFNSQFFQLF